MIRHYLSQGFLPSSGSKPKQQTGADRAVLRVAHPTIDVLQFYANGGVCIQARCGLDVLYVEYIALSLNMDIRHTSFNTISQASGATGLITCHYK